MQGPSRRLYKKTFSVEEKLRESLGKLKTRTARAPSPELTCVEESAAIDNRLNVADVARLKKFQQIFFHLCGSLNAVLIGLSIGHTSHAQIRDALAEIGKHLEGDLRNRRSIGDTQPIAHCGSGGNRSKRYRKRVRIEHSNNKIIAFRLKRRATVDEVDGRRGRPIRGYVVNC